MIMSNQKDRYRQYRRSKRGLLMQAHRGMTRRVAGEQVHWLSYVGLELVSRDEFIQWAMADTDFYTLYDTWEMSNYEYRWTPSIDRLNPALGYTLDNMNFCTISENTKRMHQMKH